MRDFKPLNDDVRTLVKQSAALINKILRGHIQPASPASRARSTVPGI
jgi:hypothetical protein